MPWWLRGWSFGWHPRRCNGGALELWWVPLPLLVDVVVVVVVVVVVDVVVVC